MKKWPDIRRFSDILHTAGNYGVGSMTFWPKIKLHGTNASVHLKIKLTDDNEVVVQARNRIIVPGDDNFGFAKFISSKDINVDKITKNSIIYGEWAGPGINDGDAVQDIKDKTWFVFAAVEEEGNILITDPVKLYSILNSVGLIDNTNRVKVLPWLHAEFPICFDLSKGNDWIQSQLDRLKHQLESTIGRLDPYVYYEYGIEGPGEGIVYYPIGGDAGKYWRDYMWKMKVSRHTETSTKRVKVGPIKSEGIDEFINEFFTEVRMNKLLQESDLEIHRKNTGPILKLIMQDVHKESKNELEVSGLEWKEVSKFAPQVIKKWWFDKCDSILYSLAV